MINIYKLLSLFIFTTLISACSTPFNEYHYDRQPIMVEDRSIQKEVMVDPLILPKNEEEVITYPVQ